MLNHRRPTNLHFAWRLLVPLALAAAAHGAEFSLPHVRVTYDGIKEDEARAIGRTVEAARTVCADKFGFDMPETVRVNVSLAATQPVRLFNDGIDSFNLSVRSKNDLRKPNSSGVFHIYGLCHELAHLAMYRPIRNHNWLTLAGAEGWAHYLGSVLVDEVYAAEGADLWPDKYDYRADGTRRLDEQLSQPSASEVARGAKLWRDLATAVGPDKMAGLFATWGRAEIDAADPVAALKPDLSPFAPDEKTADWWKQAETLLLVKRPASGFPKRQLAAAKLARAPRELGPEGKSIGKMSIAGSGHARKFTAPDDSWYLTSVEVYGSRYGNPAPPKEDFHVWLCDTNFKAIADFEIPYAKFARGEAKWVKLPVEPTNVPAEFIICVGFNPAQTKGVYVHYATAGEGNNASSSGLPGAPPNAFAKGDWMIRAAIDQPKEADALSKMP